MQITQKTTHNITFTVEWFEPTEGGMDGDCFGEEHKDIVDAIRMWDLANIQMPNHEWLIVGKVTVENKEV